MPLEHPWTPYTKECSTNDGGIRKRCDKTWSLECLQISSAHLNRPNERPFEWQQYCFVHKAPESTVSFTEICQIGVWTLQILQYCTIQGIAFEAKYTKFHSSCLSILIFVAKKEAKLNGQTLKRMLQIKRRVARQEVWHHWHLQT